jgi:metal-sulfur cluster biosynthetic enzyme
MSTDMRGWPTDEVEEAGQGGAAQDTRLADVPLDEGGMPTEQAMRTALKAVLDPEIGINIVDLGLVYGVVADPADGTVDVEMTLTSMGCPLTEVLHQQCTLVLSRLPGVENVNVNFVFSPPWSTDMISEEASDELRAMGFNV